MKLLDFLPIVSRGMQYRFYDCAFGLLRYNSLSDIVLDTYLIFYQNDHGCAYTLVYDIKIAFGYAGEYGDKCQIMRLSVVDNKPNVELLY